MKNILVLIPFLFLSCYNTPAPKKIEYKKVIQVNGVEYVLTTGSDGHDYIDNRGFHEYMCMHYIDCEKCTKKK